ncbi:MAG: acetyl-CoA carboxylase biotin carboxyl carrier protein subunit [Spirochaetaceae bacterium]|nr:acetyl-CoA carboxylase biotin carboxyl carrier protein subunit [Myxococcales bacterium]MCB9724530.1 acetyl-CoA carboxylase biotin carboxyl carrier protein subunit [Spirochaetaceae bacterium]
MLSSVSSRTPRRRSVAFLNPWVTVSSTAPPRAARVAAEARAGPGAGFARRASACPGGGRRACLASGAARSRSAPRRRRLSIEVEAPVTGNVWKIETTVGAQVEEEDVLLVIESMKMEIPVEAPEAGRVVEIRAQEGQAVEEGDVLVVLE